MAHEHLMRLSADCNECGCEYSYCVDCEAVSEQAQPEPGCRNQQCGCHTDTRHDFEF